MIAHLEMAISLICLIRIHVTLPAAIMDFIYYNHNWHYDETPFKYYLLVKLPLLCILFVHSFLGIKAVSKKVVLISQELVE